MHPNFSRIAFHGYLDEDNGEGNQNGGGNGQEQNNQDQQRQEAAEASAKRLEVLERAVGVMAQGHKQLTDGMSALMAKIEGLGENKGKGNQGGGDEDVDYETMDRKTFAAHILQSLRGVLQEEVKPMKESFGQLNEKIDGQSLSVMINEFKKDHTDFFEWKDEIRELVKENPTLTPARLYMIARAENPVKAKKMDEKFGLNKQPDKNGNDILSLFPSSGGGSTTKSGAGKMSPKQAAEAAWNEVMSQVPRT